MRQLLLCSLLILSTGLLAAKKAVVPRLPDPVRPLAEVETNVAFSVGTPIEDKWTFAVELDPSVSNCVEIVFGADKNADGVLGLKEGLFSIGWDCGEWFRRDRLGEDTRRISGGSGSRRLDWTLRLNADKSVRSVSGSVFGGDLPKGCFGSGLDLMRVVSRDADNVRVESKVSATGFLLFVH